MPISGARRSFANVVHVSQVGGERREYSLLHRYFDKPPHVRELTLVKCRYHASIKMDPAQEIHNRRSRFNWRATGKARDAHNSRYGLYGDIHGQVVFVWTGDSIAGSRRIDEPRIEFVQFGPTDTQSVHHAW